MCLNGPKVRLSRPRVVPNGPPRVTIRGQIIPRPKSLRWLKKKVSSMSSNRPSRNYRGALKTNLKTCAKWTKLRVYTYSLITSFSLWDL